MRLTSFALFASVSFSMPLAAQDSRALAEDYVALPAMQQKMNEMFSPTLLSAQLAGSLPPEMASQTEIVERISTALARWMAANLPALNEIMVASTAEVYSAAELEALIAFYSSENGASAMAKAPEFTQVLIAKMNALMWDPEIGIPTALSDILKE